MTQVARRYKFHASHQVEGLPAPWCKRHEHDYTVEVVAEGTGSVVVDTDLIDNVWAELAFFCDGQHLNDMKAAGTTTVEDLAGWFLSEFRGEIPVVAEVTVWEDDDRWGRARP